jgi:hypothetical protein
VPEMTAHNRCDAGEGAGTAAAQFVYSQFVSTLFLIFMFYLIATGTAYQNASEILANSSPFRGGTQSLLKLNIFG